jgi:alkanesulfonate monooxygenase SsuD/methylene tetrahydromethanopterin reductase-like flavin-dependent oxidoreductase (luciferase family)
VRLGLFMMPVHPPDRTLSETLAEDTEKSLLAEELGFDELWVGEHFSAPSEPIVSPLAFMATLLPRTKRLRFATGVINLPNRHPAVVASEIAFFDHLSGGRLIFGVGPGGLASDFELFSTFDNAARGRMLVESLDMIEQIWSQEPPYEIDGEFWQTRTTDRTLSVEMGLGYLPKPFQQPRPEICIAASSPNSPQPRLAGARGWSPVSANLTPAYSVATHWDAFVEGCSEIGRTPNGRDWRVARNVVIASTEEEARERAYVEGGSTRYFFGYLRQALLRGKYLICMKPDPDMSDEDATTDVLIEANAIYGSPPTVLEKLIAFRERVGPFGTLLMTGVDWRGQNEAWERESMLRMAKEVMPRFQQHVAALGED